MEVIVVPNADVAGLDPADYAVIGEKVSHRLAQRPGSYVVLKDVRPLIKLRATQALWPGLGDEADAGSGVADRTDLRCAAGLRRCVIAYICHGWHDTAHARYGG